MLKCSVEVLTNFAKRSILDVWQGSEYTFLLGRNGSTVAKFSTKYLIIDKVHDPTLQSVLKCRCFTVWPTYATVLFLDLLRTSENQRFSDVFRGCREIAVARKKRYYQIDRRFCCWFYFSQTNSSNYVKSSVVIDWEAIARNIRQHHSSAAKADGTLLLFLFQCQLLSCYFDWCKNSQYLVTQEQLSLRRFYFPFLHFL